MGEPRICKRCDKVGAPHAVDQIVGCRVSKYGNHLTPGLAEVRDSAGVLASFLAERVGMLGFRCVPALKTSQGVLPSVW